MTKTQEAGRIIAETALETMAAKAGVPVSFIADAIAADPAGVIAKRFAEYAHIGMRAYLAR